MLLRTVALYGSAAALCAAPAAGQQPAPLVDAHLTSIEAGAFSTGHGSAPWVGVRMAVLGVDGGVVGVDAGIGTVALVLLFPHVDLTLVAPLHPDLAVVVRGGATMAAGFAGPAGVGWNAGAGLVGRLSSGAALRLDYTYHAVSLSGERLPFATVTMGVAFGT